MPQGDIVWHPAFELYTRLCRCSPAETVEAICWTPEYCAEEFGADYALTFVRTADRDS